MRADFLHRFIRALDKGEVQAFRESAHLNSGVLAAQRSSLFDTLLNMQEYDAEALAAHADDRSYLSKLSDEKHRMLRALFAVVQHHKAITERVTDPWQCFNEARLLMGKGLMEDAVGVIGSGIVAAQKVDDLFAELQIRELLRKTYKLLPRKDIIPAITENEYKMDTVVRKVSNLTRYTIICDSINDLQKRYRMADDASVVTAISQLMSDPLLADIGQALSLPAQIKFASAHAFQAQFHKRIEQAEEYWQLCLSLWESNPDRIAYLPHYYRETLANLIGLQTRMGLTGHIPVLLKRLEQVPAADRRAQMLAFCHVELQYQLFYMNTGQFDAALERESLVNKGLSSFGKLMRENSELTLLYNLGVLHLIMGHDDRAKDYFTRIRSKGKLHSRLDLQGLARYFRLLLLMESDKDDGFYYFLRSNQRSYRTGTPSNNMEKVIHNWLQKHYRDFHSAKKVQILMKLHAALLPFEEQKAVGAEELRLWAMSRATGTPMRKLFEESLAK
jgi:hypothetical protein